MVFDKNQHTSDYMFRQQSEARESESNSASQMRDSDTDKTDATTIEIQRRLEVGSIKTKRPMEEVDQEVVEPIQEGSQ